MSVPPPLLSCQGLEAGYGASQVLFGIHLQICCRARWCRCWAATAWAKAPPSKRHGGRAAAHGRQHPLCRRAHHGALAAAMRLPAWAWRSCPRGGSASQPHGARAPGGFCRPAQRPERCVDAWSRHLRACSRASKSGSTIWAASFRAASSRCWRSAARCLPTRGCSILDEATEGLAPVIREEIWALPGRT